MIAPATIQTAGEYVEWLRQIVHEKTLPASDRVRAAAPCFGIAQEHHHAIVCLVDIGLYASAFALLRAAFEGYVRGEWLAQCAKDSELRRFLADKAIPELGKMLQALEQTPAFSEKILSQIKNQSWNAMCSYTHTGGLHAQRWITAESIEPDYSDEELQEVLNFAEIVGSLAALGTLSLADDADAAERVLLKFKNRRADG